MGRYVVKVEPHRAILESDYFIRKIEAAEHNRDEEIEKVEAGIEDEDEFDKMAEKMVSLVNIKFVSKHKVICII